MDDLTVVLAGNPMRENFLSAGYVDAKNWVDLGQGISVLEACVLQAKTLPGRTVCVLPKEDISHKGFKKLTDKLREEEQNVDFIGLPETKSALQSALWAADWIDGSPINIVPGDVLVRDFHKHCKSWASQNYLVSTKGFDERWGFVSVKNGQLKNFKPKSAISDRIATGFFRFSNGQNFLDASFDCLSTWRESGPLQVGHVAELISLEHAFSVYEIPETDFIPLASAGDVRKFIVS